MRQEQHMRFFAQTREKVQRNGCEGGDRNMREMDEHGGILQFIIQEYGRKNKNVWNISRKIETLRIVYIRR